MNEVDRKIKCLAAIDERLQGLKQDGYEVIIDYKDNSLFFSKLRHQNGTVIVLKADIKSGRISQLTNGTKVYDCKVCEP